ncbi:hypothetical protein MHZ92_08385 [Sporosarcina sp. ACRSL]|uniref:acetyl-CoA carboxylase biotin carboxyl carrier protein n=1 Tax=Sporosarcina sp. ACRSL TaxID=2918215 RepID=UPI001EF4F533|nr:acetyl-CoA carboxylase biotin carboxyl carrier protein subunit [Sporosarcina sp. ACRSL]MCG7344147.1 hypothetical protein [Sporosarcina sp. ACRSL]
MFTEEEIQLLQKLLKVIDNSSLRSGTLEKEGFTIQFNKDSGTYLNAPLPNEETFTSTIPLKSEDAQPAVETNKEDATIECKAPFLGTLHLHSNNEEKPMIHVGQKVKKGDVLFSIEAMKLLNEVHATVNGEITDILFGHGDLVQYGDVVVRIKESGTDD